jgi:peptide/nickel transport system substrate-binding protein
MEEKAKNGKGLFDSMDRRQFLKHMGVAGGMVAAGGLFSQGMISNAWAAEPKRGGTLTFAMPHSPIGFDPAFWETYEDYHVGEMCYNRLVLTTTDLKLEPELAERWEPNETGDQWTFFLRKGVKFSHGKELDAKDVVTSLNHYLEAKGPASSELSPAERFEVVDTYTVKAYLKTGYGEFPYNLGKPQTFILPSDIPFEKLKTQIVGTGPFKFKKFVPGEYFLVERNPDYFEKHKVYLDQIKATVVPDFATTMNALISGEIDVMWECEPEQYFVLKKRAGIVGHQVPGTGYQNLIMDTRFKPFDDNRVRQAIKACCNREQFVEAVLQGLGTPANDHPVPSFHPFYADFPIKKQNIELAKKLLAEAGYPNGLNLTVHTSEVRAGMVPSALTLKDQCAAADINIEVKVEPADGYWKQVWRKVPFHYSNWGGRPTIYSGLYNYFHSSGKWNTAKYSNPLLDTCLDEATGETDPARAMRLYVAAQAIISDEGGFGIPYLRDYTMAHSDNVHGYPLYPMKWMRWDGVWKS